MREEEGSVIKKGGECDYRGRVTRLFLMKGRTFGAPGERERKRHIFRAQMTDVRRCQKSSIRTGWESQQFGFQGESERKEARIG